MKPMLRCEAECNPAFKQVIPYMFRYSHATVLHELGVDDKIIQHREDHANQATTANIYIKNTQTMTDRAKAILSNFASANA